VKKSASRTGTDCVIYPYVTGTHGNRIRRASISLFHCTLEFKDHGIIRLVLDQIIDPAKLRPIHTGYLSRRNLNLYRYEAAKALRIVTEARTFSGLGESTLNAYHSVLRKEAIAPLIHSEYFSDLQYFEADIVTDVLPYWNICFGKI